MIVRTDKPVTVYKNQYWVNSIFFSYYRYRCLFIFISVFFHHQNIHGQCPDQSHFKESIISIYKPKEKDIEVQLRSLLKLQQQMRACGYEKDSAFMYLQQKIGSLYYLRSDYDSAIYFTIQSIDVAKDCFKKKACSSLPLVDNYYNLLYNYNVTKQEANKYRAIDSCIAYFLKGDSGYEKALIALQFKIEYLFNKGDYSLAGNNANLGEEIIRKSYRGNDSLRHIFFFAYQRANALYYSKDFSSAKKLLESKILQFKQAGYRNELGTFYNQLGALNEQEGNYAEAISLFRKAFKSDSSIKFKKGCAQSLSSIGSITAKKFKRYKEGLNYFSASLNYADASDSFFVFRETGNIYVLKGMYDSAQYFFQQAYNTAQHGMNETTMLKNSFQFPGFNQLQNLSELTTNKGDAFVRQYYFTKNNSFLKKAINVYKKNDLFLAKIKTEQKLQFASSLVWRSTARSLYEHAIDACYANNNIEDAFYFFEKSRAILLNDQVNEQRWKADSDIAKEARLKTYIIELEQNLERIPDSSDERIKIQKKLYVANQQYDFFVDTLKSKNPLYYKNYLDTSFISVSRLRNNILGNSKSLIEIFSGDSAIYVLIITNSNQSLVKINKQLYDSLATSFNSFISNPGLLNKDFKGWVNTSHQLYALVFQNNIIPDGSIIISPDGINYPFEALVINGTYEPDYFLNHYATSYTYSAKYLTNEFTENTTASNTIFGIAPVQYKSYLNLAPLAGSDHSLNKIDDYFSNATNYVLGKATKNNFLQFFPDYAIVQLYTHASDTSANNDPVIYFADSALYLSSLLPDRKPLTQLVVLSACETANGKFYQGEGIFSFNRGFAALGIPAAISNLWSVENESTYRITELFYKYLSKGLPTDVALQKAKLEFINKSDSKVKKLPYFWAGAILTGKVDTFKSNHSLPWLEITIVLIMLLGVIFLVRKFLLQKKASQNMQ